jgi:hypothetical protein
MHASWNNADNFGENLACCVGSEPKGTILITTSLVSFCGCAVNII